MDRKTSRPTKAAPLFAALGDPVRLAMIARLSQDGPLPTVRLKEGTAVSRQAVTKHLRMLEIAGLVRSQRVGRDRLWQIEARRLAEVRKYLEQISAQWDATLDRLRRFVEDEHVELSRNSRPRGLKPTLP
jgi:DNA-binding transcriptional ArsR family regulator